MRQCVKMDFSRFREIAWSVYPENLPYSFEECIDIFRCFFELYQTYFGEEHPMLKAGQIYGIMQKMPYVDDSHVGIEDIDASTYPDMIRAYFHKSFRKCDYRINHFFSGRIRELLIYEVFY